ncbi:MAG: phosphatidate cytidylyltransferase, partial [Treponemataceae bacterium]|nr:phosphatidate cytidylyltransferase [Treponemataceae bacterium]
IAGAAGVGLIGHYLLPKYCGIVIFGGTPWKAVVLGVLMGCSAIIGDLTESVLKRSADVKDSGKLIPGRGGMLDCVDSIVFSAPIYYWLVSILYHPAV